MDPFASLAARQCGVISRRQVKAVGGDDATIERMIRRRLWARVFPGVYVDHTGALGWVQRAWAAVLYAESAALSGASALHAHGLRGHHSDVIRVVVSHERKVHPREGLKVERAVDFERVTQLHLSPPRMRIEPALLRVASRAKAEDEAVAVVADGCQSGRTTAARLGDELALMPKLERRALLRELLTDVEAGAMSALERRYLRNVERAHGLPNGLRQRLEHSDGGTLLRDVEYPGADALLELDGRLGHEWAADRWNDLDRDIQAATTGRLTVRAGWRQVLQPCRLARAMEVILVARGWTGCARPCGPTCLVGRSREDPRHQVPEMFPESSLTAPTDRPPAAP